VQHGDRTKLRRFDRVLNSELAISDVYDKTDEGRHPFGEGQSGHTDTKAPSPSSALALLSVDSLGQPGRMEVFLHVAGALHHVPDGAGRNVRLLRTEFVPPYVVCKCAVCNGKVRGGRETACLSKCAGGIDRSDAKIEGQQRRRAEWGRKATGI